ncbi:MAG TPA: sulfate adenylyltransferase [Candidatus Hydrogenedens sp.]|nr:sulfate adenylyltransferase [Candidatus Hydrogenedens sp.]HOK10106.1 sulfate adenylyltransferase [Candidatus Hydrogenedens sp.]HOL20063.1 sulfate adenylyltransferase [Candidatus Hydrogenedens sp.]HPP59654.1 sulfate adenylyltransferase [Candidatus Hydrogenedens sp.]
MAIEPHGGVLVNRFVSIVERNVKREEAKRLKSIQLDEYLSFDLDCIAKGIFSPLEGFMCEEETLSCLETMHLRPGIPWTIPILLDVSSKKAEEIEIGENVALYDTEEQLIGIITVRDKFCIDKKYLAEKVYGTLDDKHPGVKRTYGLGDVFISGRVEVFEKKVIEFEEYNLPPEATRHYFEQKGWNRIVAFQTRNPIHRAHEYLTKCALEICDGLLIHPLMGTTKSDDIPGSIRMECYKALIDNYYPKEHVLLSIMPVNMRYAGPKEAIMHAIVRKNYGCTHFIVGRDHAGVGNYYGTYDAQKIFDKFEPNELKITPLFFDHSFYCRACGNMASIKTCPHDNTKHVVLSGTKVREMLKNGETLPEEFTRPEVSSVLQRWAQGEKA